MRGKEGEALLHAGAFVNGHQIDLAHLVQKLLQFQPAHLTDGFVKIGHLQLGLGLGHGDAAPFLQPLLQEFGLHAQGGKTQIEIGLGLANSFTGLTGLLGPGLGSSQAAAGSFIGSPDRCQAVFGLKLEPEQPLQTLCGNFDQSIQLSPFGRPLFHLLAITGHTLRQLLRALFQVSQTAQMGIVLLTERGRLHPDGRDPFTDSCQLLAPDITLLLELADRLLQIPGGAGDLLHARLRQLLFGLQRFLFFTEGVPFQLLHRQTFLNATDLVDGLLAILAQAGQLQLSLMQQCPGGFKPFSHHLGLAAHFLTLISEFDKLLFQHSHPAFQVLDFSFFMNYALLNLIAGPAGYNTTLADHVPLAGYKGQARVLAGQQKRLAKVTHQHAISQDMADQPRMPPRDLHQISQWGRTRYDCNRRSSKLKRKCQTDPPAITGF